VEPGREHFTQRLTSRDLIGVNRAWWTNGPNWPENGEIDIAEGVSDHTYNQATVHTARGCQIPSRFNNATEFAEVATGRLVGGTNCAVADTSNQGCGVRFQEEGSFGAAFNAINGGVYARKCQL
jgi:hypothetical protein